MGWVAAFATLLTALAAVAGGLFAIYRYVALRERLAGVRAAFQQVVDLLGSEDPVHRRTGAIMLRRFFDEKTEQGGKDTPYAGEALNVMAATLRGAETGAFQKLLADGLAFAPSLEQADLQKTNLQQAYLGARGGRRVDLSGADFFRADLTGTSLKGALAKGAVFYQARLVNTVLRDADLENANFFEADVGGADFRGAALEGATFARARNVPAAIRDHLDVDGIYDGPGDRAGTNPEPVRPIVFFSRPGAAEIETRRYLWALADRVRSQGFDLVELERGAYSTTGAIAEVRRVLHGCSGVVVAAVADIEIAAAEWRSATPEARVLEDVSLPSSWTMIEFGLGIGLGLPVFVALADGLDADLFDFGSHEPGMSLVRLTEDHRSSVFQERFDDWTGGVREEAARRFSG